MNFSIGLRFSSGLPMRKPNPSPTKPSVNIVAANTSTLAEYSAVKNRPKSIAGSANFITNVFIPSMTSALKMARFRV